MVVRFLSVLKNITVCTELWVDDDFEIISRSERNGSKIYVGNYKYLQSSK